MSNRKDQVLHIAHMARIELQEKEVDNVAEYMDKMQALASKLEDLNTDGVQPTTHIFHQQNVMRDDVVKKEYTREEVLKNVPSQKDGQIKVPTILE